MPYLNSNYVGDSLNTIGGDVGYNITPGLKLLLGYYYQDGDLNTADSSGVKTRLTYNIANGVTVGFTYSYDAAFQSVATGDIKWRFRSNGNGAPEKQKFAASQAIKALSSTPANRDVRVHDSCLIECLSGVAYYAVDSLLNGNGAVHKVNSPALVNYFFEPRPGR